MMKWLTGLALCGVVVSATASGARAKEKPLPIPDKLVVLTFDDGNRSDITRVAPLLKRYGFGGTFFITEGVGFTKDKKAFLTWDEVRKLHRMGFEIGNHTRSHPDVTRLSTEQLAAEVEHIERRCGEHGIAAPKSFCYPGWRHGGEAVKALSQKGYLFARRGSAPERPEEGNRGVAYDPAQDHPLLIPTTGASGPNWGWEDFLHAVGQARDGKVCVLAFHGVPASKHPWVNTDPKDFARYMKHLHDEKYTVIALRDLARYVDPAKRPDDPYASIMRRLGVMPAKLKCEYAVNPLGIDTPRPRFSWILESSRRGQVQSAYQVLAASSEETLNADSADMWDSGKVTSGKSVHVAYDGKALSSGAKCWWKVRCWDKKGKVSAWSQPATFEMGLLKPGDWRGKWIGSGKAAAAPLLRKEFRLAKQVKRARAYISGLGWSELYINGKKVGDRVLDPATTYYNNDQPVKLGSRVLYVTLDVTDYLRTGPNALGVMLGNGWYSHDGDIPIAWGKVLSRQPFADDPIVRLQLNVTFTDGTSVSIVSDDSWKASGGPITSNEICRGESHDARLEKTGWTSVDYDDSDWGKTVPVKPPSGAAVAQTLAPVRVMKTIKPVKITKLADGIHIYDFGQHFSGWSRLRVSGPRGAKVTLRHAGAIDADGRLDIKSQRNVNQTDTYTLKGEGLEVWEPRFTLHGFRYVEMTGFPGEPAAANLEGRFVYNSVETSGGFECSNPLLNRIHRNACWTFMSSLQGIPQDAADRPERVAWLGDTGFVCEDYLYNLDTAAFWAKWLDDIKDSQKPDGDVPVVSPLHWRNPYGQWFPCWKSTYPVIAWHLYQYYGDNRVLAEHYDGMKRLVGFLDTKAENHLIKGGLGDHMEPDRPSGRSNFRPRRTPGGLTSTAYYYYDALIVARAAEIIGKADEAKHYAEHAERIKKAFIEAFFDEKTNQFATGSQTANAVALFLGLVPKGKEPAVLKNLVDDIMTKNEGHLSTGILGADALEQVLGEHGRADVMYTIATKTTYPSWGYSISKGATTVWESFEDDNHSLNMKMFGSTEKFFYKDLAGIGPAGPGYELIRIKPCVVGDLTYAKASIKTVRGLVSSHWRKKDNSLSLEVVIPVNSSAKVSAPKMGARQVIVKEGGRTIWEAGKFVKGVSGVTAGSEAGDYVTFDVGSGPYAFSLTAP